MTLPTSSRRSPDERRSITAAEAIAVNRHLRPGDSVSVGGHAYTIAELVKTYPDATRTGHPITTRSRALVVDGAAVLSPYRSAHSRHHEASGAERQRFAGELDDVVEAFRTVAHARSPHLTVQTRGVRRAIERALD